MSWDPVLNSNELKLIAMERDSATSIRGLRYAGPHKSVFVVLIISIWYKLSSFAAMQFFILKGITMIGMSEIDVDTLVSISNCVLVEI